MHAVAVNVTYNNITERETKVVSLLVLFHFSKHKLDRFHITWMRGGGGLNSVPVERMVMTNGSIVKYDQGLWPLKEKSRKTSPFTVSQVMYVVLNLQ